MDHSLTDLRQRANSIVEGAIAERRIVGAVVLVIKDGQLIYQTAAGWADREVRKSMAADTMFRFSSLAKPLVTVAALRLVEQKKLSLNSSVTDFLSGFTPRLANGIQPSILIRHLLSHSAGLSYRFLENKNSSYHTLDISDGLDLRDFGLDENLRRLAQTELAFSPGTSWKYSLATDVLGGVLEKAAHKTLPQIISELVCEPLGMKDTEFTIEDTSRRDRLSVVYYNAMPEPKRLGDNEEVVHLGAAVRFAPSRIVRADAFPSGGAGMAGTAADFARFAEALQTQDEKLLHSSTWQMAMTDQVGPIAETQGPGWGFGFGWAVLSRRSLANSPQSEGTLQWGGAYGHNWFVDRAAGVTVVALTNTLFEGMSGAFVKDLRDAIYGAEPTN